MTVLFFGNFGLFYVNASLLQYGRGFSVLQAGLGIIPLTLPLLVGTVTYRASSTASVCP